MMKTKLFTLFAAACLTLAFAGQAEALRLGPLAVTPYAGFSSYYDDNIFVQNSGRVDDFYFVVSPGLLLQLPQRDNRFELEYRADIFRYVDTGPANDVEDHYLRAGADLNFSGGLRISLDETASINHEARGESNLAVSGVTPINRYYYSDLGVEVAYAVSERFTAAVSYANYYADFDLPANDFRDRSDNAAGATVYYRFMPKTSLLAEGLYKNVYHTSNSSPSAARLNSDEYWAMGGLKWEITAKSTGEVRVGYEWKDFDHPAGNDFDGAVYIVELDHRFTPKTSVMLEGVRQAKETDDPAVSHYTTTSGTLRASFAPRPKVRIDPYGSFAHNRYSGATTAGGDTARRLESVWSAGLDIGYDMNRWLRLTAGYKHAKRSSTITFYDYTDNVVTLGVRASL